MLAKIKGKIVEISKVAGIEMILLPDSKFRINMVLLQLEKKSVKILKKQQTDEFSPDAWNDFLEKDTPFYLVLNGRGILHKKVAETGLENAALLPYILPNTKAQDFYIQNITAEKSSFVSIVRKEMLDPILESFQKKGLYCIGFSLGGTPITAVRSLIAEAGNSGFTWAGHSAEMDASGRIIDYKFSGDSSNEKHFQIGTEKIEEAYLVSYSAAFSVLINHDPVVPFIESIQSNKKEFLNKVIFKKASWTVLGVFLLVLMLNFILFARYSEKNNELIQKESKYRNLFSEMETLTKEVKEKESFLAEAGWLQFSNTTYFADRIGATVPASVRLTELSINPVDAKKSKEARKEIFASGIILIKGECKKPTELNEWLDKIKHIDKINKARLLHYVYDNKESKGLFSIEIETY